MSDARVVNLGDPRVMQAIMDRFFSSIFHATEMSNEQQAGESMMQASIELLACFSQEYEGVIVPAHLQVEVLAKRLTDTLIPLGTLDESICLEKDPKMVLLVVISNMAEEFMQILATVHQQEQTQDVFDLRCQALKAKWIQYFLGE